MKGRNMDKKILTRRHRAARINDLLQKKVSARRFGEEMFDYIAFEDELYAYEKGYESMIKEVLDEFTDMHDLDKGNVGYIPHVPNEERLEYLEKKLLD
jgi:hypothetical protein